MAIFIILALGSIAVYLLACIVDHLRAVNKALADILVALNQSKGK